MLYLIARRSFHHSCFQSLIIRVPETKLGLFNYNEFAMYPSSKSIHPPVTQLLPTQQLPTQTCPIQISPTLPPLNQSNLVSSHIHPLLPNLAIPVSYIHKSS